MRGNWLELLGKRVSQCQIQLVIRMASASTHCARRRSSGLFIFLAELIKFCPRGGANSLLQVQPTNIKLIKQRALFACGQEGEWVRGKRAWPPAVRPSAFLAIPPHYSALRFASHLPAFNQTRLRRGLTHYISRCDWMRRITLSRSGSSDSLFIELSLCAGFWPRADHLFYFLWLVKARGEGFLQVYGLETVRKRERNFLQKHSS